MKKIFSLFLLISLTDPVDAFAAYPLWEGFKEKVGSGLGAVSAGVRAGAEAAKVAFGFVNRIRDNREAAVSVLGASSLIPMQMECTRALGNSFPGVVEDILSLTEPWIPLLGGHFSCSIVNNAFGAIGVGLAGLWRTISEGPLDPRAIRDLFSLTKFWGSTLRDFSVNSIFETSADVVRAVKPQCVNFLVSFLYSAAHRAGQALSESIGNPGIREASKKAAKLASYSCLTLGAANLCGFALAPYVGIGDWGIWSEGFSMGHIKGYSASYNPLTYALVASPVALPVIFKAADESLHKTLELLSKAVYDYEEVYREQI